MRHIKSCISIDFILIRDTLEYVVRNNQLPPISKPSREVASFIKETALAKGVSQETLRSILNRGARSYISLRLNGRKAWDLDELDTIAPALGFRNGLDLISAAQKSAENMD